MQALPSGISDRDTYENSSNCRASLLPASAFTLAEVSSDTNKSPAVTRKRPSPSLFLNLLVRILHKLAFIFPGGSSLRPWLHRLRGVKIGQNIWIAQLVYIDELHPGDVEIGDNCTIGYRSSIFTHFYWGHRRDNSNGKVIIENDVFVGPHCVILPNVKIGEGAVIRAGTVVSRNVPPHAIWGTPAAEMLGIATVPLTPEHSYDEFTRGMRPAPRLRPRTSDSSTSKQD